jgi:MOSC domain-containing protein YiiM
MKLLSINIAMPRAIQIGGEPVLTGIYKVPVEGPLPLGRLGLAGDGQADLTVHGGEHQAVYGYPHEHYAHWESTLDDGPFAPGTFGENFTTLGLLETDVFIGDLFRIGTATLQVTAPRLPCFKFAHKMGRPDILKPFLQSGRCGFYFRVDQEGTVTPGDAIVPLERSPMGITMRAILGLMKFGEGNRTEVERALELECLAPCARRDLEKRLAAA